MRDARVPAPRRPRRGWEPGEGCCCRTPLATQTCPAWRLAAPRGSPRAGIRGAGVRSCAEPPRRGASPAAPSRRRERLRPRRYGPRGRPRGRGPPGSPPPRRAGCPPPPASQRGSRRRSNPCAFGHAGSQTRRGQRVFLLPRKMQEFRGLTRQRDNMKCRLRAPVALGNERLAVASQKAHS